jgi:hypothetical protein
MGQFSGHVQMPFMQVDPATHTLPQLPQLVLSLVKSKHAPPHRTSAGGHGIHSPPASQPLTQIEIGHAHSPSTQVITPGHGAAHWAIVVVVVELVVVLLVVVLDVQLPLTHVVPPPQTLPQAPQLLLSLVRSKHASSCLQKVSPATKQMQVPPVQVVASAQTEPQLPQLSGSRIRSKHSWPHRDNPAEQVQLPLTHTRLLAQALPQAPQFLGSVVRLAQTPLQRPSPVGQQRPNSAAPCLTVGFAQFRVQQDIEVWHCWPFGLQPPARESCAEAMTNAATKRAVSANDRQNDFESDMPRTSVGGWTVAPASSRVKKKAREQYEERAGAVSKEQARWGTTHRRFSIEVRERHLVAVVANSRSF